MKFPTCLKCKLGQLVPFSYFGPQGAAVHFAAWVCINPACLWNLTIRAGAITKSDTLNSRELR